ncbi:MAG: Gfo/Idh/MocA family oxidoreductase [Prolixibacteraceae bacterium]|jgi:predicted dehydrogenase|nr:Gfo/Idh/MocA family oxidoreductase [Prolixibacteraceae bacterium]HPJ77564.1 Gfo/Idh/MocA family oxidoreductase [Prolixibacteraceae bacterium]HRV90060.1 Gfo/Idh/MocA family oxidoreductase [Prolixibacteraceae bacterium]
MDQVNIGFLGAGGIARAHAYALKALAFYYPETPAIGLVSVASARPESREAFATRFGFSHAESPEALTSRTDIDTVFIMGPNHTHFGHFRAALAMKGIRRIYLEKPVCSSQEEEVAMVGLAASARGRVDIQVGFQYLQTPAVREALAFWKSGILGKPVHFDLKYYHGDYLRKSYREKRVTRLTPAPDGGAMADLGSHGLSLLTAFLGNGLQMVHALQAGTFPDVPAGSDLFSSVALTDPMTGAAGHLSASRITAGSGDLVLLEIFAEKGALRFSSQNPDYFEYFLEEQEHWVRQPVGSHYRGITAFPSGHVPAGWLRSMVHAHYLFLGGSDPAAFVPTLTHGLEVQRLVRETAFHLTRYREQILQIKKNHP